MILSTQKASPRVIRSIITTWCREWRCPWIPINRDRSTFPSRPQIQATGKAGSGGGSWLCQSNVRTCHEEDRIDHGHGLHRDVCPKQARIAVDIRLDYQKCQNWSNQLRGYCNSTCITNSVHRKTSKANTLRNVLSDEGGRGAICENLLLFCKVVQDGFGPVSFKMV